MSALAKSAREKMKAKARMLAGAKEQKVDSSDWTPAPLLKADVKTGARPITKPSSKGIGESNAARDTKSAIGDAKRGAYKSGGAIKDAGVADKKALGKIDPKAKRAPAQHYKRGGKAEGGSSMSPEELKAAYAAGRKRAASMPEDKAREETEKAIDARGNFERLVGMGKKSGGAAKRTGRATGGALYGAPKKPVRGKNGKTDVNIVISTGRGQQPGQPPAPPQGRAPTMPPLPPGASAQPPMAPPGAGAPPPGMPPMPPGMMPPGGMPPGMAPPGRKAGGRISKVASSYKDMQAGAASGEGRLQKTDIASKKKGAPTK